MKNLTVFIKSTIESHPQYSIFTDIQQCVFRTNKSLFLGYLFTEKDRYFQYVSSEDIIPFIGRHLEYIDDIDWSVLKEAEAVLVLSKSDVETIEPFDNKSFWRYATRRIVDIDLCFIRKHKQNINFKFDANNSIYIQETREYLQVPAQLSLSQKTDFDWNNSLLEEFKDFWNWTHLSLNPSINWSLERIELFSEYLDFKALSCRKDIQWSIALIDKFIEHWNWTELSSNTSLPWNYNFLKHYEEKWVWTSEVWDFRYLRKSVHYHHKPKTISHNNGISWTFELFEFIPKVDIWSVAVNAYMSPAFIALVHDKLDETRLIETYWTRVSDWSPDEHKVYRSGWESILSNKSKFYS